MLGSSTKMIFAQQDYGMVIDNDMPIFQGRNHYLLDLRVNVGFLVVRTRMQKTIVKAQPIIRLNTTLHSNSIVFQSICTSSFKLIHFCVIWKKKVAFFYKNPFIRVSDAHICPN